MNLHFLKLRVTSDPWILVDRCGANAGETLAAPEAQTIPDSLAELADWHYAATLVCHPYRGAAARGLMVVEGVAEPYRVQSWNAGGLIQDLPPAAALCAARWLFDTGRAVGETVSLTSTTGPMEILVLDSRNFGLALGNPRAGRALPHSPDRFSIALPAKSVQVRLHDGPIPQRKNLASDARDLIQVGCLARHELQLRVHGHDVLEAAGAAVAAASLAAYADRDCTVRVGGNRIMVQWPDEGPMFLAAAPAYCLAGDIWLDDESDAAGGLT